jgi:hypothetical protein
VAQTKTNRVNRLFEIDAAALLPNFDPPFLSEAPSDAPRAPASNRPPVGRSPSQRSCSFKWADRGVRSTLGAKVEDCFGDRFVMAFHGASRLADPMPEILRSTSVVG